MFCIAAFLLFGILAIFSASYRPLAAKAWYCVVRRVTFRPCDINFSQELKGKILGKIIFTRPRLASFLSKWFDWIAGAFVVLSIWSLVYVANAGLNLWVYDTCDPSNAESCSLSGEACGVDQAKVGLATAVRDGRLVEWATGPFLRFGETVSRIPDRLRTWEPERYLSATATFYTQNDPAKPTALEVIDPSCKFCKKLTGNLLAAGIMDSHNVSYLLYPIPSGTGGTKFPHSRLMASYIEATKRIPLPQNPSGIAPDWQLLEKIFQASPETEIDVQTQFVMGFTRDQALTQVQEFLREIGYTDAQIAEIARLAASPEVAESLRQQREIVENQIRTIKIPTLLIGGRRFDRVIDGDRLRAFE